MAEAEPVAATPPPKPFTFLRENYADYSGEKSKRWFVTLNNVMYAPKIRLPFFRQFNGCGGATLDGFMDFYSGVTSSKVDFTTVWKAAVKYLYDEEMNSWQMPRAYMLLNFNGRSSAVGWLRENGLKEICTTPNVYHGANGLSPHVNTLCYWDWTHLVPPGKSYARYEVVVPKIVFKETNAG